MEQIEKISAYLEREEIEKAQSLIKKNGKALMPEALFYQGEIWRMKGFFERACVFYMKYISSAKSKSDKKNAYLKMAACKRALGLKKESLYWCRKALALYPKDEEALLETAMTYRLSGLWDRARGIFLRLKKAYLAEKDYAGVSYILWALGGLERSRGELESSKRLFMNSLKFARLAKDRSLEVYALFGLGGVCRIKGELENSLSYYRKASSLSGRNDTFAAAYSFCGAANALRQLGDLDEAEKLYEKSRILYRALQDKPDLGFVYWGKGEIKRKKGKLKEAFSDFKTASKLFSAGFEKRGEILSALSSAKTLYAMGRKAQADKVYFSAVESAKKEGLKTYLEDYT